MTARLIKLAAWLCLGSIIFVTVSPIGLRPRDVMPVNLDRALAFSVMAGLFTVAYPRHWLAILLLTTSGASLIEGLQFLSPTRHAHLSDAMFKAAGAAVGVVIAKILMLFAPRSEGGDEPPEALDDLREHPEVPEADDAWDGQENGAVAPSVTVLWTSETGAHGTSTPAKSE